MPRHIACSSCREQKVKCDGSFPSCARCIRYGSRCIYTSPGKASLANSNSALQTLRRRLRRSASLLLSVSLIPRTELAELALATKNDAPGLDEPSQMAQQHFTAQFLVPEQPSPISISASGTSRQQSEFLNMPPIANPPNEDPTLDLWGMISRQDQFSVQAVESTHRSDQQNWSLSSTAHNSVLTSGGDRSWNTSDQTFPEANSSSVGEFQTPDTRTSVDGGTGGDIPLNILDDL
jgi:hypothetical protein